MDWPRWLRRWFGIKRTFTETVVFPATASLTFTAAAPIIQVAAARVQAPSRWLARQLPKSIQWLAGLGWLVLFVIGLSMIQVDEYLVADVLWFLSILVLTAKAITWGGIGKRPKLTLLTRLVLILAAISFFGFMMVWTYAKKADKAWSNLMARKPETSLYIECLPGLGQPFPPRGALYLLQVTDRWSGMVMFTGISSPSLPVRPAGVPSRCSVTNDGTAALFSVSIPVRLRFYKAIEKATEQGGESNSMGEEISSLETEIHASRIDPGHSAAFEFFVANSTRKYVEMKFLDLGTAQSLSGNPERPRIRHARPFMNPMTLFPAQDS